MSSCGIDRPICYPGSAIRPIDDGAKLGSLASLSLDPQEDALSKQTRHSLADEKFCMIALEYYNRKKGTNYELACANLFSNAFKSDGTWVHCNFAASLPNVASSGSLFFAEMHLGDAITCTWTVTACILLEGNLTAGCSLCSKVIHPTHGFRQGHHKPKPSFQPTTYLPTLSQSYLKPYIVPNPEELKPNKNKLPDSSPYEYSPNSYSPTSDLLMPYKDSMRHIPIYDTRPRTPFPTREQVRNLYRERAGIALDYYNKEKGADYEIVDVLGCQSFLSGVWFHCNFTAKPPNGDIPSKLFFGEICLKTSTATACIILEEGCPTTDGCNLCLKVIHPTDGFLKGRDKNDVRWLP